MLSEEIAEQHADTVSTEAAPGAGDVAVAWYECKVDGEEDNAAYGGEDGSPPCFGDELVPE